MPLDVFIAEAVKALGGDADEVAIGDAKKLGTAAGGETIRTAFSGMNR
jgi:hypothetical protein